jgi:hypothetical protein
MAKVIKTNIGDKGGLLVGKPHNDKNGNPIGGIKAKVVDTNEIIEVEGKEAVINPEASKKNWKELSKINQSIGGGVPIVPPSDTSNVKPNTNGKKNEKDIVITDDNGLVELKGGSVIINKKATEKYYKELSRINQSAGDGVEIQNPKDLEGDVDEYKKGGTTIQFNPNNVPSRWVYGYAKKIKNNYPEIWDLGGNIYGNEAFINLERVIKRGYWLEGEEWFYVKWQSFNARHKGDFLIAGVIANLKWLNKVEKGWDYMKKLIEAEIEKRELEKKKMSTGGNVKQPTDLTKLAYFDSAYKGAEFYSLQDEKISHYSENIKKSERWFDLLLKNQKVKKITPKEFAEFKTLSYALLHDDLDDDKAKEGNENQFSEGGKISDLEVKKLYDYVSTFATDKITINKIKGTNKYRIRVYDMGFFTTWVENAKYHTLISELEAQYPNLKMSSEPRLGNDYNPPKTSSIIVYSKDETMALGGELEMGIEAEQEHNETYKKIYNHEIPLEDAPQLVAEDHLEEDEHYYTKLAKMEGMKSGGKVAKVMREFNEGTLETSHGDKVTDKKQAMAIALSEQRKYEGKKALGGKVFCEKCGHSWHREDNHTTDVEVCHKCGHDNRLELNNRPYIEYVETNKAEKMEKSDIFYNPEIFTDAGDYILGGFNASDLNGIEIVGDKSFFNMAKLKNIFRKRLETAIENYKTEIRENSSVSGVNIDDYELERDINGSIKILMQQYLEVLPDSYDTEYLTDLIINQPCYFKFLDKIEKRVLENTQKYIINEGNVSKNMPSDVSVSHAEECTYNNSFVEMLEQLSNIIETNNQ